MNKVTVEEIKQNIEVWLQKAESGEKVQIVVEEKVVIELKPCEAQNLRPFGLCQGDFLVPIDFDEPLPADIMDGFE